MHFDKIFDFMKVYRQRIADKVLERKLQSSGLVVVEGAKWCGKTTTAEQMAGSVVYMNDPKKKDMLRQLVETDPQVLLEGAVPRLVDEWQDTPKLWDAARFEADHRDEMGQFIFTGSAVPGETEEEDIEHSGTGRASWLLMRPMSLWESGESDGKVSLRDLFEKGLERACAVQEKRLAELAYLVCRGGWPAFLKTTREGALDLAVNYVDAVTKRDISRVDGVKRDAAFARRLLRSLARHQGTQAAISTIYKDLEANEGGSMSEDTISSYLQVLRRIFVVEDMPAWNPSLRSKSAIRTSDTRYFVDPSIGAAALGVGPEDLMGDLSTMGLLFEALCVRDLRVYADALGGDVFHFRDRNGLECDAVVHLRNGRFGLVEIKLGGESLIEAGASTLKSLAGKIDTERMRDPSFLMVLTGTGEYAYRRDDGVLVVPIGCLKD